MNGIQSLMPGQAAPQGMPPGMPQGMPQGMQPQPSSPQQMMQSQTPMLKQLPKEQLVQLFAQEMSPGAPQKFTPLLILSAISDKVKQEQMQRAMQMQQVQQQNAQQPPGTVAQQVLSQAQQPQMPQQMPQQPVMAAHGGAMHSYADGGAVAFQAGGIASASAADYVLARKYGIDLSPYDPPAVREDKIRRARAMAEFEEQRKTFGEIPTEASVARDALLQRAYADPKRSQDVLGAKMPATAAPNVPFNGGMGAERTPQPSPTTFDITSPGSINALRMAAQDTSLPEAERADLRRRIAMMEQQAPAMPAPAAPPRPALTPEEEGFYSGREATLQGRRNLPPEVLAGRQGLAALAAQNLAAQRAEAEQFGTEARQRRDEAMARAGRNIFTSPDAASLFSLAGSIDTRPGQALGSASRGLANLLAKQEEARAAAGREYATAQQTERMLQANIRQANMLEEQRKQAVLEREPERVAQIEDALARNSMERSQLMRQRQEYAEKMALEGRRVGAMEADATAKMGRETLLELFKKDPQQAREYLTLQAEVQAANRPTDRSVLTYAQAAKIVDERLSEPTALMILQKEEEKLAKQQGRAPRSIDQLRAALIRNEMEMAGGVTGGAASANASSALPPGVTVKRIGQ